MPGSSTRGKETEAEKTAALTRAHVRTVPPADHAKQRFLDMVIGEATKARIRQAPLPISEREAARATYWQRSRGVSSDDLLQGFADDHQESWEEWRRRTFHVDGSTMREEERAELFAEAEAAAGPTKPLSCDAIHGGGGTSAPHGGGGTSAPHGGGGRTEAAARPPRTGRLMRSYVAEPKCA